NVSQNSTGAFLTVAEALAIPCTEEGGYEIKLLDLEHIEQLEITQSSLIHIKGTNKNPVIWYSIANSKNTIGLIQGNLTLENIEFRYQLLKDPKVTISPAFCLIGVYGYNYPPDQIFIYTSLTARNCIFQSVSYVTDEFNEYLYDISVGNINQLDIDKCSFKGVGMAELSNILFLEVVHIDEVVLSNSTFSDILIFKEGTAVMFTGNGEFKSIIINKCEFINMNYSDVGLCSAVSIQSYDNSVKAYVTDNKFINCNNLNPYTGAIFIVNPSSYPKKPNEFVVEGNTFTNNAGNYSGAIFLDSFNTLSSFSFKNNKFSKNLNNQTSGIGKDVFIHFSEIPDGWTKDNIGSKISEIFEGSQTDAGKDSIYYLVGDLDREEVPEIHGDISLPELRNKWWQNKYAIIGISVGSLVLVVAVVSIVIIGVIVYRKKKGKHGSSGIEGEYLLAYGQKESK
ncbi:MAG: hypothetical protein EZS28_030244, partial [Streblomastix strix]